ncbi:MAG: tetratricopeptide repeat protein [Candidatus Riflebacteria bacterium]|nr:tetratricopeptide repeat protein [Candidatus Riflebacteria bacterium]
MLQVNINSSTHWKAVSGLSLLLFCTNSVIAQIEPGFSFVKPSGTVQELLSTPANKPKANTYYLIALSQAQKGNSRDALTTIERGLRIEPDNLPLLKLKAGILARTGNEAEAIKEFQGIIKLYPEDDYAKESLKLLLPPGAYPAPKAITPPPPNHPPIAPIQTSSASEPAKKTGSGTKILDTSYFEAIRVKQVCFHQLSAIKRAYDEHVKNTPADKGKLNINKYVEEKLLFAPPLCPEAGEFSLDGVFPKCSKHGTFQTLETEVKMVLTDFNRGMQAKIGRVLGEAQKAFEQVVLLYPKWAEAHYQLADTYFRIGMDKEALLETRKCLDLASNNVDAKMLLANLYFKTGQKEASLKLLDQISQSNSGGVYGLSARSMASAIRSGRLYYQIFPPY